MPVWVDKVKKQLYHFKNESYAKMAYLTQYVPPGRYVFVLTNLCNLSCPHCFQERTPDRKSMKREDWLNVIDQLPSFSSVTLTGGEPLIYKSFPEIFKKVANKFRCNVISNGIFVNEQTTEMLLGEENFSVLGISIDGFEDVMLEVRTCDREKYNIILNNMRYFLKRRNEMNSKCVLDIKTVILDRNAEELFDLHRFVMEDLKADHHNLYFLKGSPIQHADFPYEMHECYKEFKAPTYKKAEIIKEQCLKIEEYDRTNGGTHFFHPKITTDQIDLVLKSEFVPEEWRPCVYPWASVHINHNGEIYPCLAIPVGNVKETPLLEIFKGDTYKHFTGEIRRHGELPACNRCGWLKPK